MEKLKITVTKQDIKKGVPNNEHLCPIARAVRRRGYKRVTVDALGITTCNKCFEIPMKAYNFIDAFDAGAKVTPIKFIAKGI